MSKKVFLTIFCLISVEILSAQEKYDVFFLNIGAEHYTSKGYFGNLEAASNSAKKMAILFRKMGAKDGEVLLSSDPSSISNQLILKHVDKLIKVAKKSKSENPLLIVYYAGHGYSSGLYKAHFIPPGSLEVDPSELDEEEWIDVGISPLDIREKLDASNMDYMLMLDCCYEGEQRAVAFDITEAEQNLTGTTEAKNLFGQLTEVFDNLSTMTGPDPVIFSCAPGASVPVTLFNFSDGKEEVAPLCRRSFLAIQKLRGADISLSEFVKKLKSDTLDSHNRTKQAYSTWVFDEKNLNFIYKNR